MKKGIGIIVFSLLATLSFGQVDSSAWEGKVVLMSMKASDDWAKKVKDNWYLTDTSHLIIDTLLTRDVDSFGEDTIVILRGSVRWFKHYAFKNCLGDCLVWGMCELIKVKNLINQKWETIVVFAGHGKETLDYGYQRLLVANQKPSSGEKKVLFKIGSWSKELEALLKERFKGFEVRTDFKIGYDTYQKDDAIIVFKRSDTDFVEILDARTWRVIEKIKVPVSKE
jgi:hypothetical protein